MAAMITIAQIEIATGFVMAVVDMIEPLPPTPPGMLFQECDTHDRCGMFWNGIDYQKQPLKP